MNKDTRLSGVLHVLLHLGQVNTPQTSEVMAKTMGTNAPVFRRTMAGLREAGYVHSEKGHGGGWRLARPLSDITLLDVYNALNRPGLFAIASRNDQPSCKVEQAVNRPMDDIETTSVRRSIKIWGIFDTGLARNGPGGATEAYRPAGSQKRIEPPKVKVRPLTVLVIRRRASPSADWMIR